MATVFRLALLLDDSIGKLRVEVSTSLLTLEAIMRKSLKDMSDNVVASEHRNIH